VTRIKKTLNALLLDLCQNAFPGPEEMKYIAALPLASAQETMDTKMVSQSVDEATKALKSRMTEGSSKLFGSMRDAKRGLLGGITSTFDHVVNIVGGPETAAAANANSAPGASMRCA